MNVGEDVRMSLRSIQKRPIESLLLVLGIALGIGATAAGGCPTRFGGTRAGVGMDGAMEAMPPPAA